MPVPKKNTAPPPPPPGRKPIDWRRYGAGSTNDDERITWKASTEGDTITGRVTRVAEANTRFGTRTLIEISEARDVESGGEKVEGEEFLIWPTQGLLDRMFAEGVCDGDMVTITLEHLIDTGKGSPFKDFGVKVYEASEEPF